MRAQPTLTAFSSVVPDFTGMALEHLDNTIANWKRLEEEGFTM
jgi:hypothetical protein